MKYSFLTCFAILSASASAAPRGLRPDGLSGEKSTGRTTADEDPAPNPMSDGAADGTTGKAANPSGRDLQGCYRDNNDRFEAWHPNYSVGWTNGHCRLTIDCNLPSYPTELACCKAAYAGQILGSCLM